MTALISPAQPQTVYRCAWCKCEGDDTTIRKIPGTEIWLCQQDWLWYRGFGERREVCKEDE